MHTEIRNSAEFHTQHRKNFEYGESAGTKRNLEKSGVGESRLRCICVSIKYRVLLQKLGMPQHLKKFPAFYGTRMSHRRVYKSAPVISILSQMNPVHAFPCHLIKIHPNILHPSTFRSSKWSVSFRSPHQNPVRISVLSIPCCMLRASHSPLFHQPCNM